jgi:hypothetical protein
MGGVSGEQLSQIALSFGAVSGWVLLPLVPAILIHRVLPKNTIEVNGPLQGLTVKATGGIASYLVLLLLVGAQMQSTVFSPIKALDDGTWHFNIPFIVQDGNAHPMLFEGGARLTAETTDHPNPDVRRSGFVGYTATFYAPRVSDGHLPTVTLVAHLSGGATASSQPIDLDALAAEAKSGQRDITAPMRPLRMGPPEQQP